MFNSSKALLALTLFWIPSSIAYQRAQRIALVTAGIAGYLYFTEDGRKKAAVIKISAKNYFKKAAKITLESKKWCTATLDKHAATLNVSKEWLIKKLTHTSDHALMLEALARLDKQTENLEKQNKVLTRQSALILNKLYELEALLSLAHKNRTLNDTSFMPAPEFLTANNEVNEQALIRSHKNIPSDTDNDLFNNPDIIVMEAD